MRGSPRSFERRVVVPRGPEPLWEVHSADHHTGVLRAAHRAQKHAVHAVAMDMWEDLYPR